MSITFGSSSAPSQVTINLDALFSQSLAKYSKTLSDNIASANAFFHLMKKADFYQGEDGGTDIRLPLMYALSAMDSYDGFDELGDNQTDGVTQSVWQWRQEAVPITYSMREVIQNKEKLIDLVETKITQAEMGFAEGWPTHFFQGAGTGQLATPRTSPINGSLSIEPIGELISYTPTTSATIGNINQSTSSWWQNQVKTSAATDLTTLLEEAVNLYNTCSRGTGGPPDLIVADQVTYEALVNAIYLKWRKTDNKEDANFPFEWTRFKNAKLIWDDKMVDVANGLTNTNTKGSLYMINTKFFRIKYINGREFDMLKDDQGKTFAKPLKGDSRLGHMAWMGQVCVNNRRKHGVMGNIARTFTNT